MNDFQEDYTETLTNVVLLVMRQLHIPFTIRNRKRVHAAIDSMRRSLTWDFQDIIKRTVREEIVNLLAETRIINGKMDSLTDRVIKLERLLKNE